MARQLTNDALQAAQDRCDEREADEWDELEKKMEPCPKCGPEGMPCLSNIRGLVVPHCDNCGLALPGESLVSNAATKWNARFDPQDLRIRFAKAMTTLDLLGWWENDKGVFQPKPGTVDRCKLEQAVKRFLEAEAVVREAPAVTGKQSVEWLNALSALKELFLKD